MDFLQIPHYLLNNLDVVYSGLLVFVRYTAFLAMVPGIGGGERGVIIRVPAALIFMVVSLSHGPFCPVPTDWIQVAMGITSEFLLGTIIGVIPQLIVIGVQTGAQIASSTMGLGANQLLDPTTGAVVPDLARLMGDLTVVLFLIMDGHHVVLQAVAGLNSTFMPGSFAFGPSTLAIIMDRSAEIFSAATMISAPVVVALLLTQFVMGMISRAVPSVNIFIISFPLTIGIGMILSILALPEIVVFVEREFSGVENVVLGVMEDTR